METVISKNYDVMMCKHHFKTLWIFSDSEQHSGEIGQSIIRNQENTIGLSVCKTFMEGFKDEEFSQNCIIIDADMKRIKEYAKEKKYSAYGFPQAGIGINIGMLPFKAPKTFCYLTTRLIDEFNYNNLSVLTKILK
jgi:hypothetical protein